MFFAGINSLRTAQARNDDPGFALGGARQHHPASAGPSSVVSPERENTTLSRRVTELRATAPVPLCASLDEPHSDSGRTGSTGYPGAGFAVIPRRGCAVRGVVSWSPPPGIDLDSFRSGSERTEIDESFPDCFIVACYGVGKRMISRIRPDDMTSADMGGGRPPPATLSFRRVHHDKGKAG